MSNSNLPNQSDKEELDLHLLFTFLERRIKSVFRLFFRVIKTIFDLFISILQVVQKKIIIIISVVIIAFGIGYFNDMYRPKVFFSKMRVSPLFNTKYQLITNINYYNELVRNKSYNKLSDIFDLNNEEAKSLVRFNIDHGLDKKNNDNEKIKLFNSFVKKLDTAASKNTSYKNFVETMTIYDADTYDIEVSSISKNIFQKLSKGFKKTFKNDYSEEYKRKKDIVFNKKKESILRSLKAIDSLKNVYITKLSKDGSSKIEILGSTAYRIEEDERKTKEFELTQLQIVEENKLSSLEEEAIKESELFQIISDFQEIGSERTGIIHKMKYIFPLAACVLMALLMLGYRFNKFLLNYKA